MKPGLPLKGIAVAASLLWAASAQAQHTFVYAYDSLGRLTNAGTNNADTVLYVMDPASNRRSVRCCETGGGEQVKDDGFDPYFYLQTYPDIRAAGVDPYTHWLQAGASENRWPNRYFNTAWYRMTYGVPVGTNPLTEYHTSGWQAGRNPSPGFSTALYQSAHPDILNAAIDPLQHYLRWGYGEAGPCSRSLRPGISVGASARCPANRSLSSQKAVKAYLI